MSWEEAEAARLILDPLVVKAEADPRVHLQPTRVQVEVAAPALYRAVVEERFFGR